MIGGGALLTGTMRRRIFWTGIVSVLVFNSAASLHAQEKTVKKINVFPPAVQLDSARDFQTIIVQAIREDSVTEDVTDSAKITLQNTECAVLERIDGDNATSIRLSPKQDGDTVLVVTYEGHRVELPVSVRSAAENPPLSFRLDVMPVFARAGCNMGSCHGAARGKDGFRLSLFGFDPTGDYHRLTREMPGRRINLANPEGSLLVQKAVGAVPHTGGKRFEKDSELADRLVRWIAAGAKDDPDAGKDSPKLQAVDLYPPTTLLEGKQATQQLVAVARFSDGTDRDVTDLVWYGSNNDSSVAITPSGNAASGQRGESFVMARYDTITVGVPVVVIPKGLTFEYPESEGNTWVDDLVDTKLKSLRITPSNVCDDETYLRRVTIDLVGLLPTEEERNEFLADESQDKRSKYVEKLLSRKEFVDLWVMKWAEILQIRSINNIVDKKGALLYHQWLDRRIASNQPLNIMVQDLITASGGTFENPPTNYYQAERNTLKLTENVAQAFLGMRIQCAQCHNHPFDRWTMDDYYGFAAFFAQIGRKRADDPRETIVYNSGGGGMKHPVTGQTVAPKYLGGAEAEVTNRDRREAVAEWLVSPENPFFAKRIANLVWTHFFGRGIVHEPDDFRVSNPPVNGPLLNALASHLVKSEWDFRELVREIVNSKTYQRECDTNDTNLLDNSNFSHSAVRRIRAEVLLDILAQVTETKNKFPGLPEGARAVQVADGRTSTYFLTTFGRATREEVCSCAVSMDPSLSQALHLLNGDVGNQRIQQGGVIDRWIKEGWPDTEIIDELFVRCYGRLPQERERVETLATVQNGSERKQALEDVFWALLNSPEFIFNH